MLSSNLPKVHLGFILCFAVLCYAAEARPLMEIRRSVQTNQGNDVLVGAPRPLDVNSPEIQKYAKIGFEQLSDENKKSNELVLVEVIKATEQVVSGTLYKITMSVGLGNKNGAVVPGSSQICVLEVWSQPWIDEGHPKINIDCNPLV